MAIRKYRGLENRDVVDRKKLLRDVRPLSERLLDPFKDRTWVCLILSGCPFFIIVDPGFTFAALFIGLCIYGIHRSLTSGKSLPMKMPQTARRPDPNSPAPGRHKLNQAGGIIFLGNEVTDSEELWLEKKDILTHALVMGTTGAGKTVTLVSLSYNALATGAGIFYIDPKAAPELSVQMWQMARFLGRDDDFRVLNYGTAGKENKLSRLTNTNNPFSLGSAESLTQLISSLIPTDSGGGGNAVFGEKALNLIAGLLFALVDLRDKKHLDLSVTAIRSHLTPAKCVDLVTNDERLSVFAREALKASLLACNWNETQPLEEQDSFFEQFGYAQSYFGRALSSLSDTYGHIYSAEAGEVDFQDVVLNRRILTVMLPAMEKSAAELSNLGKITLSSIRAAAAVGLGMQIEGDESDVLGSLPIHFQGTGPFLSIVDEYAAIVTPGFEILLTQGRGLGMATIVASQDYAGIVEADKKGAQQIVANTNVKIFMKMQEPEKTYELLKGLAGEEFVAQTTGFQVDTEMNTGSFRDNWAAGTERRSVVDLRDLMEQTEGEAHIIFQGKLIRANMFYADPKTKGATLRVPRMLQMEAML